MSDLMQDGGVGAVGALFGAILAWAGFRERMKSGEDRVIQLEKDVVYQESCNKCEKGSDHRFTDLKDAVQQLSLRITRVEDSVDKGFSDLFLLMKELKK